MIAQLAGQAGLDNPHLALGGPLMNTKEGEETFLNDLLRHDSEVLRSVNEMKLPGASRRFSPWLDPRLEDPVFGLTMLMDRPEGALTHDSEALRLYEERRAAGLRSFLASNVPGLDANGDGEVNSADEGINVTEYIMGGRTVNERNVLQNGIFRPYSGFMDGGVQFSKVVAEASFPESDDLFDVLPESDQEEWRVRDKQRMRIAKGYLLGYQNGLDAYHPEWVGVPEGQLAFGYENRDCRKLDADIIGPWLKGVSRSMGGLSNEAEELNDDLSEHELVIVGEDVAQKLRGPNGVFADLACDGALEYSQAVRDMERGRVPSIPEPSAVDRLLAWAGVGYEKDLKRTLGVTSAPWDDDPRSKVAEATAGWAQITETLFEAPDSASNLREQAVNDRNEVWKHRVGSGVAFVKGIAGIVKNPVWGVVAEIVDHELVQPTLDDAFPTDFQRQNRHTSKQGLTEKFVSGILGSVAAETVDFSKAPTPLISMYDSTKKDVRVVDAQGNLLPFDAMDVNSRGQFFDYIYRNLSGWEFDDARRAMRFEAANSSQQNEEQKRHEDVRQKEGEEED